MKKFCRCNWDPKLVKEVILSGSGDLLNGMNFLLMREIQSRRVVWHGDSSFWKWLGPHSKECGYLLRTWSHAQQKPVGKPSLSLTEMQELNYASNLNDLESECFPWVFRWEIGIVGTLISILESPDKRNQVMWCLVTYRNESFKWMLFKTTKFVVVSSTAEDN